jgi:hypothetical protein
MLYTSNLAHLAQTSCPILSLRKFNQFQGLFQIPNLELTLVLCFQAYNLFLA